MGSVGLGENMYRYETHLHTAPVSRCGKATVEETVRFYGINKQMKIVEIL